MTNLALKGIYEVSKICMDYVARSFSGVFSLPIVVTRACNIYGEYDFNRRIIPNTIESIKKGVPPVIFQGDESIREYIYVNDACDAYLLLAEHINKTKGEIYNVGSEHRAKQYEIVQQLIEVSGAELRPQLVQKPPDLFEIFQQTLDSEEIQKDFGWKAKFDLETGLRNTWQKWT
jgi:dTDP-D-glucose 4,6-dehydratase